MGVVAALFGWRIYQFWEYTVDDAYITLRYARNVVEGYGLVYNPGGPRVEGYSNPLLLLFQCVVLFLNGEGMLWTKILGALAGFATLAACLLIALDLLRWAGEEATRVSLIVSVAGVFYVADNAPLSTGSVSGLETSLFAALLTWGTWGFLRVLQGEGRRAGVAVAGLCLGLATWTRPEGIAWAGGVAGLVVLMRALRRESVRAALVAAGLAIGLWLALEGFRLAVFGDFQPNTYYAKMGGEAGPRFSSGMRYVLAWAVLELGWIMLLLAAVGLFLQPMGRRGPTLVALLAVVGFLGMVAYEGGDWIPHGRLVAPVFGVMGGLSSAGLGLLVGRLALRRSRELSVAATLVFCVGMYQGTRADFVRGFREVQTRVTGWSDAHRPLGEWLGKWREKRGGRLGVALSDIGMVGWFSGAQVADLAGLTDRQWARLTYQSGGTARYPAKRLLAEQQPEAIVLVSTERPFGDLLDITWRPDCDILADPEFARRYRHRTVFTHKDFASDGYYLHVFLRRDIYDEAPAVTPPVPRTHDGM